ncbi:hypothetical protein GCM10007096_09930 [Pullulanibacillus pueri]|uniref:Uncharacterized protein n=1 Tax=Pullulanibacillus pueri TaxID=1437324 RepID=A0A8J3EL60_9BACL|nr:hypothetical protein GCM10007096_09930 [Pullulanibacillus pueri]
MTFELLFLALLRLEHLYNGVAGFQGIQTKNSLSLRLLDKLRRQFLGTILAALREVSLALSPLKSPYFDDALRFLLHL